MPIQPSAGLLQETLEGLDAYATEDAAMTQYTQLDDILNSVLDGDEKYLYRNQEDTPSTSSPDPLHTRLISSSSARSPSSRICTSTDTDFQDGYQDAKCSSSQPFQPVPFQPFHESQKSAKRSSAFQSPHPENYHMSQKMPKFEQAINPNNVTSNNMQNYGGENRRSGTTVFKTSTSHRPRSGSLPIIGQQASTSLRRTVLIPSGQSPDSLAENNREQMQQIDSLKREASAKDQRIQYLETQLSKMRSECEGMMQSMMMSTSNMANLIIENREAEKRHLLCPPCQNIKVPVQQIEYVYETEASSEMDK